MATPSRGVSGSKLTSVRPPVIRNSSVGKSAGGDGVRDGVSAFVPEKERDRKGVKVMALEEVE